MKTFSENILAMPKHYPGNVHYQNTDKFTPISISNVRSYNQIGHDAGFEYFVKKELNSGYIFEKSDLYCDKQHALPVMTVSLRESGMGKLKQAHSLRIRSDFSRENLATSWYIYFVNHIGGIVSDFEHLQGGKALWKSFIKIATQDPSLSITLFDTVKKTKEAISPTTNDADIWSLDDSKKNAVLILLKKDHPEPI